MRAAESTCQETPSAPSSVVTPLRTNFLLIDFENVQPESLSAFVQEHFQVIVFVGANHGRLPFALAVALQRMGEKARYVEITGSGRNALDFHIAFYIGQLAALNPTAYFYIISKDAGFDPLVQHLKSRNISSRRSPTIDDIPLVKAGKKQSADERAQLFIANLKEPKVTHPHTEKALANAINVFFKRQLSEQDVAAVIRAMQSNGFITVVDGKISYALA